MGLAFHDRTVKTNNTTNNRRFIAALDFRNDDARQLSSDTWGLAELHRKVDHGHDTASQIDYAANPFRRFRNVGYSVVLDDLLDLKETDCVLFAADHERQILLNVLLGVLIDFFSCDLHGILPS